MDELFGIPMGPLAVGILIALAVLVGAVGALALRNRILLKLGIRNLTRRRARTALIVLGLMLGTAIISSALATGDTMSHTIRSSAITSLGETDELVSVSGADVSAEVQLGSTTGVEYFSEDVFPEVEYELLLGHEDLIDGVAPAIIEPLAVQSVTTRQSEPRVTLFASRQTHLAAFGNIERHSDGAPQYLNDLQPGEVFLNAEAAEELQAEPGHELRLYAEGDVLPVRVREVVDYQGAGTDGAGLMLPLDAAQELRGREGEIKHVLISNRGDGRGLPDRRAGRRAAWPRGSARQGGRARGRRRRGQRLHDAVHDLRQLLDLRRSDADLPHLRHARRRAAR